MGTDGRYHILDPGRLNGGAGPDFTGARVLFPDGTVRRGDAELHLDLSGWAAHGHGDDPRYAQLLVHVVGTGQLRPIRTTRGPVPTLLLPREPLPASRPCEANDYSPSKLSGDEVHDLILILAAQRWHRRLAGWQLDTMALLPRLAGRLGRGQGAEVLHQGWLRQLPESSSLESFLMSLGLGRGLEPAGATRRRDQRRARLLSVVAHQASRAHVLWLPDCWGTLQRLIDDLQRDGFDLPGVSFAVELAGNWLLPRLGATSPERAFRQWMELPVGWRYSRVKRLTQRLGQAPPATFGRQQGWLEWDLTLCSPGICEACPVSY